MANTKFVGIRDLAKKLGLSYSWIKQNTQSGVIPHVRDGDRFLFPIPEAIDAATKHAESMEVAS